MRINTNMAALNAWRSMETNQNNLQKSLSRLSSGYRINTAADDAAGLAVSEKMTAQVRGINMAVRNGQDAVSLVQTAEGGAGNIQGMLQRMRELAVQASSDTLQDSDRTQLQQEFSSLQAEIDRTANSVTFNGRNLLNGSSGSAATITSGTNITAQVGQLGDSSFSTTATQYIHVDVNGVATSQTTTGGSLVNTTAGGTAVNTTSGAQKIMSADGDLAAANSITISQKDSGGVTRTITVAIQDAKAANVSNLAADVTFDQYTTYFNTQLAAAGVSARISFDATANGNNGGFVIKSNVDGSSGNVTVTESAAAGTSFGFAGGAPINGIASQVATGGADASLNGVITLGTNGSVFGTNLVSGTDYTIKDNVITGAGRLAGLTLNISATGITEVKLQQSSLDFQVGANKGETISTSFADLRSTNLGVNTLDISSKTGATAATTSLDSALSTVSTQRAKMGAMQNRLDNTISSLQTQSENLTAANSRIRDVDMAGEMANFTKFQVLSQASTAMLAQANQLGQGILSLLR